MGLRNRGSITGIDKRLSPAQCADWLWGQITFLEGGLCGRDLNLIILLGLLTTLNLSVINESLAFHLKRVCSGSQVTSPVLHAGFFLLMKSVFKSVTRSRIISREGTERPTCPHLLIAVSVAPTAAVCGEDASTATAGGRETN
jgi:hypothetical protein